MRSPRGHRDEVDEFLDALGLARDDPLAEEIRRDLMLPRLPARFVPSEPTGAGGSHPPIRALADACRLRSMVRRAFDAVRKGLSAEHAAMGAAKTIVATREQPAPDEIGRARKKYEDALGVLFRLGEALPAEAKESSRRRFVGLVRTCLHAHLSGSADGPEQFAEHAHRCDPAFLPLWQLVAGELGGEREIAAEDALECVRSAFDDQIGRPLRGRGSRSPEWVASELSRHFRAFGDQPRHEHEDVIERFRDAMRAGRRQKERPGS
jgi:hypothetical protein